MEILSLQPNAKKIKPIQQEVLAFFKGVQFGLVQMLFAFLMIRFPFMKLRALRRLISRMMSQEIPS